MMAYLPTLSAVVLVGGTGTTTPLHTWMFKGGLWSDITSNSSGGPTARWAGGLVYDAADGYLLLFGGRDSVRWLNDTWTFNGTTWSNLSLSHAPAPRAYFTMVYDPTDSYVVLFSGGCYCGPSGARVVYNDTWTYHGGAWSNLTPTLLAPPPLLTFFPGAWDAHDGYIVVFGGNYYGSCGGGNLTWTFVGGAWTNRTTGANAPAAFGGNDAFAYDPVAGEIVYFGGTAPGCTYSSSTAVYQNGRWTDVTSFLGGSTPPASSLGPLTWDAGDGYLLLYGGQSSSAVLSTTYALWLNSSFLVHATASPSGGPAPLTVHFVAAASGGVAPYTYMWDPGDKSANASGAYFNHTYATSGTYEATVLVNDSATNSTEVNLTILVSSDTWYNFPTSAVQPPWAYSAAMTYDPQFNGLLLFGGDVNGYPFGMSDQTWEYVGGIWQNISTQLPVSPSARFGASLAFDANDSYALLFGGFSYSCTTTYGNYTGYDYCNDTWTFTPSSGWSPVVPNISPPARYSAQMADDPPDGYVVLFGGVCAYCSGSYGLADDTWVYRAGQWTDWTSNTVKAPKAGYYSSATYDDAARAVVIFGGASPSCTSSVAKTWEFSSGNWTDVTKGTQPPDLAEASLTYDAARQEAVLMGGLANGCSSKVYNQTWIFSNGSWTDATTTTLGAPPTDYDVSMQYDAAVGAVVFVGDEGLYYSAYTVQPVWSWPGTPMLTTISATPSQGIAPFNVTFQASTSGGASPYTDTWQFGDGSPNATGGSVTHEYLAPGNYSVLVTANDSGGRTAVVWLSVLGYPTLLASPAATRAVGQVPWSVHFYSNATGGVPPLSRSWSFGDGSTSSAASPVHPYTTAGNYTANLTIRDASGISQSWSFPIQAVRDLTAAPSATPVRGQTPLMIDFTAGDTGGLGPYSFDWSFGDGSANSTIADPIHTYSVAGAFSAQFKVSDSLGDVARGTILVSVTVPLVAGTSVSPATGLAPLTVRFLDQSAGGSLPYNDSWSFGDGSGLGYGPTVDHTYVTPGVYTATESVTDAAGTVAQQTDVISVVAPLTASVRANATLVVRPASVQFDLVPASGEGPFTYAYRFGDGGTATGSALANHTFATDGTFEVRGTITDSLHEVASAWLNVTVVAPLTGRLSADPQTLVVGQALNLSALASGGSGPFVYAWSGLPPGCAASNTVELSCEPSAASNYTISVRIGDHTGQNITISTWVLVTSAGPQGGGTGASSGLSLGILLGIGVALVVVAAIAALLVLRRSPPKAAEPEEPAFEEPFGPPPTGEEPTLDGRPGEP
jgi:PKD repeat protein